MPHWYTDMISWWKHLILKGFTLTPHSENTFCYWLRTDSDVHSSKCPLSFHLLDCSTPQMKRDVRLPSLLLRRPQGDPSSLDLFRPPRSLWPALWRRSAQPAGNDCWGRWTDIWGNTSAAQECVLSLLLHREDGLRLTASSHILILPLKSN